MLDGILTAMMSAIVAAIFVVAHVGPAGLMALESACIPVPSEVVMPVDGYLASTGRFNLWLVATAGTVGCTIGSTVAYYVGAFGGAFDRASSRYGGAVLSIGRLLPVSRTFIAMLAAGDPRRLRSLNSDRRR